MITMQDLLDHIQFTEIAQSPLFNRDTVTGGYEEQTIAAVVQGIHHSMRELHARYSIERGRVDISLTGHRNIYPLFTGIVPPGYPLFRGSVSKWLGCYLDEKEAIPITSASAVESCRAVFLNLNSVEIVIPEWKELGTVSLYYRPAYEPFLLNSADVMATIVSQHDRLFNYLARSVVAFFFNNFGLDSGNPVGLQTQQKAQAELLALESEGFFLEEDITFY